MSSETNNYARVLTPAGPGAVAVLELHISDSDLLNSALAPFRRHAAAVSPPEYHHLPLNRILLGSWHGEDVLLIRTAPAYWEIHCHGGVAAVRRILEQLALAGLCIVQPGASTGHSCKDILQPGKLNSHQESLANLIEAAVRRNLSSCRTRTAADWVLRQLDGRLLTKLTQLGAADPQISQRARTELCQHQRFTDLLLRPIRVGLFGPPNAGKSSLLNTICGRERAIVSPQPGTTRDTVAAEIQTHGWALSLNDTAGLHQQPESPLEFQGIRKSLAAVAHCDAACILVPVDQPLPDLFQLNVQFSECPCRILVLSRSDLPVFQGNFLPDAIAAATAGFDAVVQTSATEGRGTEQLLEAILKSVLPSMPDDAAVLPLPGVADDMLLMARTEHSSQVAIP